MGTNNQTLDPPGVWSVRLPDGTPLKNANGVNESEAWHVFIHLHCDAVLVRGETKVAERNLQSPTITRQFPTLPPISTLPPILPPISPFFK